MQSYWLDITMKKIIGLWALHGGPKVGTDGYFKVAYGASGIADTSNT